MSLAVALVKATMAGDTVKGEQINKRLYQNADEISALLAFINPYWNYGSWRMMFYTHLDLAKKMATEMIEANYTGSIDTYDRFERGYVHGGYDVPRNLETISPMLTTIPNRHN